MRDEEILKYLQERNFEVNAQDCIMDVFNTSYQIKDKTFDIHKMTITIITDKNIFTFKWKLNEIN